MAGLGGKNWTFQEEVTSSDVNGYLADQVVMRFADSTARTAGFGGSGEPTLAEGMISYLDDTNRVDYYNGSIWRPVSQVDQFFCTTETVNQATTSTTFVDLTNSSISITPQSTSNRIFLSFTAQTSASASGQRTYFQFVRGSTALFEEIQFEISGSFATGGVFVGSFYDSPSSTSAQTYKIQIRTAAGTLTVVNWAFTVMEIVV